MKCAVIWVLLMFGGMILDPASADRGSGIAEGMGPPVATFSIVGYDPNTGDLGVAVQSKFFGVGSVVPWARAGVGAIATLSYANVSYGTDGFKQLEVGKNAAETPAILTGGDQQRHCQQVAIVDAKGRAVAFTGSGCHDWAGHIGQPNFCVLGSILVGEQVVQKMAVAFQQAENQVDTELADGLMAALQAAQEAGGEKQGRQSAALLVVRKKGGYAAGNDRYINLRVEDYEMPIIELGRLLKLHQQFFRDAHKNPPGKSTKKTKAQE